MKYIRLIYLVTFVFILLYFFEFDYSGINFTKINPYLFLTSSILLYFGYFPYSYSWKQILNEFGIDISFKDSYKIISKTMITKYVPGKIAFFYTLVKSTSNCTKASNKELTYGLFVFQILIVITGLAFATLLFNTIPLEIPLISLILFLLVCLILSSSFFIKKLKLGLSKLIKVETFVSSIKLKRFISVLSILFLTWLVWSIAFLVLLKSLGIENIGFEIGFIFPVAVSSGILLFIAPGGLGFREGAMVYLLLSSGLSLESATTISIISRLWFICVELIIFFLGWLFNEK
ncbi:MAG: flippase-like domain-containing protein [Candidatus Delongbacteria bacterium]|nr:flippase-like domain-containing protein [Candidatus Delongbacteria bacterium]